MGTCKLGSDCCATVGGRCRLYDYYAADSDFDAVEKPKHYTDGSIEFIQAAESVLSPEEYMGFLRGNVLKYVWRCGKKGNSLQDAKKAKWYIEKFIE